MHRPDTMSDSQVGFLQHRFVLTLGRVPYLYVAVAAPRYELRAFGVIIDAEDVARVAFEDFTSQTLPQQALFSTTLYQSRGRYVQNRHPISEWCDHLMR
jgi:hypothetical protein